MCCVVNVGNEEKPDFTQRNENTVVTTEKIRKISIKDVVHSKECR